MNVDQGEYRNALQAAIYMYEEAIVKLLLMNRAEVIAKFGEYKNALLTRDCHG